MAEASGKGWVALADVVCDVRAGAPARRTAERLLRSRCAGLPLGARVALARRPSPAIVAMLRDDVDAAVLEALAGNPRTTAADVARMVERPDLPSRFLAHLATSPWTARRDLLRSIARHARTPHRVALTVLRALTVDELAALAHDPLAPRLVRTASERRSRA